MTKQILLSLLNCSWQWLLLSGLIWFATSSVFRKSRRSNATVHLLWLLSLLSLPMLFGLNQFVPALSIDRNPGPELAQVQPIDVSGLAVLTTDLPAISSVESGIHSEGQRLAFFNWESKTDLLLCAWAIGALAMLIRFMFGLCRIYQLRRGAVTADDSYQAICQRLARQLNINRPVTVCFSDRVASPISFGWLSPYILIPRKLDLEQFELVAAHELAHVQRLDWLTNLFSHAVGVIFFFHPIYHFLNRELVHLRERICDDWVIQLTGARKSYAQCLLDLVRHRDRGISLALSLNQPSQLESRIDSILKSDRRLDVQLKPRLQLIVATLLLTCLPLLAMAQLVPLKTFQVSLFAQTPQESGESDLPTATPSDEKKEDEQKAADEKPSKNEESEKRPGEKAKSPIIIHEIDKVPDHDWVELYNASDGEINLKGWTLGSIDKVSDYDWVELYNASDGEINLKGWTLGSSVLRSKVGGGEETIIQFDEDVKIPAGSYLLLLRDDVKGNTYRLNSLGTDQDSYLLLLRGDVKETAADFVTVDVDHFITVDVKEDADGFYFVPDPESPEKLRIILAEDALRLERKKKRPQVMEKDSDRKREQELSLEELFKQVQQDVELLQRLLTEKDGMPNRKQELSLEELLKQMSEDVELLQRLLVDVNEDAHAIKKDNVRKREQNPSPEERIKRLKEDAAQLKERLKQLQERVKLPLKKPAKD